ncbi:MAG TPA: hypothetical protein VIF63_07040 [Candidatus Limnocylindrales bacterium]
MTPEPTVRCVAGSDEAELDLLTARGHFTIELLPMPLPAPELVDASIVPVEGILVGGAQLTAEVQGDFSSSDAAFTAVTADFVPFGTTAAIPLDATFEGSMIGVGLQDSAVSGRLRIFVAWTTPCGSREGSGEIGLTIVNSSVVAGCPTTGAGMEDAVAALQDAHVTVGTAELPFTVVAASARWFGGNIDSLVPQFSGWDRGLSVVVAPATSLLLKKAIEDLSAISIRTTIYKRADVIEYLSPDSTIDLRSVSVTNRTPGPKGNVGLPVPDATGSYVYEIQGQWQTSCINVETYMVVSVEVR